MVQIRPIALGDQLSALLREQIIRGELTPGTHLVEDSLAAEHSISRGPVRDALRTLQAEGLLESRRRGYFVRAFTNSDIDELYQIRRAAEALACELALSNPEADWRQAQRHLDTMRQAADRGDSHAYAQADLAFHTQFYINSGSARLLTLWSQYQPTFTTLLEITNEQDPDLHPSLEDHQHLLEFARAGRLDHLLTALAAHLAGSRARMDRAPTGPSATA